MHIVHPGVCRFSAQGAECPWGLLTTTMPHKARAGKGLINGPSQHPHFAEEKNKA